MNSSSPSFSNRCFLPGRKNATSPAANGVSSPSHSITAEPRTAMKISCS